MKFILKLLKSVKFQHAAARRRLFHLLTAAFVLERFNTQPPEGGCFGGLYFGVFVMSFNTQPPEGG